MNVLMSVVATLSVAALSSRTTLAGIHGATSRTLLRLTDLRCLRKNYNMIITTEIVNEFYFIDDSLKSRHLLDGAG